MFLCIKIGIYYRPLMRLILYLTVFAVLSLPSWAYSAKVMLAWDRNGETDIAGYRVYYGSSSGHYPFMLDAHNNTSCTIYNLEAGKTYYFAATAYDFTGNESGFSAEIPYPVPFVGSDAAAMPDDLENHDGRDSDSDETLEEPYEYNDMADERENLYGLNPDSNDAWEDSDGDGKNNINQYRAETPPAILKDNVAPDPPLLYLPYDYDLVATAPLLQTDRFYDPDVDDAHGESRWQIVRAEDNVCVFDRKSSYALTSLSVPKLVLEEDTDYIWKVKYIDDRGAESDWSQEGLFTTDVNQEDGDGNGIADHQEIGPDSDLDEDGIPDIDQEDMKCVGAEGDSGQVCVSIKDSVTARSIEIVELETPDELSPDSQAFADSMHLPFGLIHFKLTVEQPGDEVEVVLHLSNAASPNGIWYKYDPVDEVWVDYSEYADFSPDRKSVYLYLTDGGFGDADGIANRIVVDPLALGVPASSGGESMSGCFISSAAYDPSTEKPFSIWPNLGGIDLVMISLLAVVLCIMRTVALRKLS